MKRKAMPTQALAEMYRHDEAVGLDPTAFDNPRPEPVELPSPIQFDRPNWRQEALERERAERLARQPAPAAELEDTESYPASKKPKSNVAKARRTRDEVKAMLGKQP
jgi:hypothetical protein